MKKNNIIVAIMFLSMVVSSMTSCAVRLDSDNGRHRGWFHRHEQPRHQERSVLIIGGDNHRGSDRDRDSENNSWDRKK